MKKYLILLFVSTSLLTVTAHGQSRIKAVKYFYHNYSEFKICLGDSYGCHRITRVSLQGNRLRVFYSYKSGELEGYVEENGVYEGNYSTTSSNGQFLVRFESSGEAYGSWGSVWASGDLSFVKK